MNGDVVQAGIPLAFNYGAYDQSSTLFVALKVYDITAIGAPVLVATVGAVHIFGGAYLAKFTPDPNKAYATVMTVYTDGTYTVADPLRSPDVTSFSTPSSAGTTLTAGDIAAIASAVWDLARAGHDTVGTFGEANQGVLSPARAANLDNLNAPVATVQTTVDAIKVQTDKLNFDGSSRVLSHAQVVDDKTGYALSPAGVDAIWDENVLADHVVPGSAGQQLNVAASTTAAAIADAIWDEPVGGHTAPNTFGDYVQVILQFVSDNNDEITNGVHGLAALKTEIDNAEAAVLAGQAATNALVNAIPGDITAAENSINANVTDNKAKIISLTNQVAANLATILSQFMTTQTMISTVDGHVLTLQNNTTARFVVPDRMVIPPVPEPAKNYTFELRLYDSVGNPAAPDSTPTISVIRLDTGLPVVSGALMTQYGAEVGAYYYTFPVNSAFQSYPALVEARVVEGGVARLIPAVSETSPFEGDLSQVINQLTQVQTTVDDIDTLASDGTFGFAALKTENDTTQTAVAGVQSTLNLVKAKTDLIPAVPASQADTQATTAAVLTRPTLSDIVTQLNVVKNAIMGPDSRNLTQVYDVFDLTPVAKTNDPRFSHLNADISSRSILDAATVWGYSSRTLTSAAGLTNADVKAIWDYLASQATTVGSLGKRVADFLDASVGSRATSAQVTAALAGVALESTVTALNSVITNGDVTTQLLVNAVNALVVAIKAKTDHLPSDPASESGVESVVNAVGGAVVAVGALTTAVKAKTDNLPIDPAHQSSVVAIPTNPVLDSDARLGYLDIAVSTRATPAQVNALLGDLATQSDVENSENDIISAVDSVATQVANQSLLVVAVKSKTDHLPADPASNSHIDAAVVDIIAEIDDIVIPPGLTAAEVWSYATRTLTSAPVDISTLATHADVAAITQYANEMSTAFDAISGNQEVIAWATKNGQRVVGANCSVSVRDASGGVAWSAGLASPNADGVFKFQYPVALSPSQDYYVVISIEVDAAARVNQRPFMTVG